VSLLPKPPTDFAYDYPSLLRQILWTRGFRSNDEVKSFLNPSLSDVVSPHGKLLDLEDALGLLLKAKDQKSKIVVFGDYDVDGASSTSMLVTAFREMGFNVSYFVPHRVREGYGITTKAVQRLLREEPEVKLIVSCDCGISSFDGIEILKNKGVQVIVTDHHEVPENRVQADAIINPKQKKCQYPDKKLAGVGVAFLLLIALRRAMEARDFKLKNYLDFVALGTVCDLAELVGTNRAFVKAGLEVMNSNPRPGIQAIRLSSGFNSHRISSQDLGFIFGPRINACGRMGDPRTGIQLLLSEDLVSAKDSAHTLEELNQKRRQGQNQQAETAIQMANEMLNNNPNLKSLVLADENFHLGLVGLIASRLTENFKRPSCVLTKIVDEHALANYTDLSASLWKGSLRAPLGTHLAKTLQQISQEDSNFFVSAGGHAVAAGIALREENLKNFPEQFEKHLIQEAEIDSSPQADAVWENSFELDRILSLLEPLGQSNPAPRFYVRDFRFQSVRIMKEKHLKLKGAIQGRNWSVLQFKSPWVSLFKRLETQSNSQRPLRLDFVGELFENEWNGKRSLELKLCELIEYRLGEKRHEPIRSSNEVSQSTGA